MKTPELGWLLFFMVLDAISTFDGFVTHKVFGYWPFDLNPLVNYLVAITPWALIFFFIGSFGLCVLVNEIIKRKYPERHVYFRGFLCFFVLFELIAVINNYFVTNNIIALIFHPIPTPNKLAISGPILSGSGLSIIN